VDPVTVYLKPQGLFPSPNPRTDAPKGALKTATNVDILAPGVVTPRKGYESAVPVLDVPPAGYEPVKLIPFDEELFVVSTDGADWTMRKLSDVTDEVQLDSAALSFTRHEIRHVETTGALLLTSAEGVLKLEEGSVVAYRAGREQALPGIGTAMSSALGPFEVDDFVAYRVVYYRPDGSGRLVFSAPSSRFIVEATVAGYVELSIPFPPHIRGGDYIQVYRSKIAPDEQSVSDDLYLAVSFKISAADALAGTIALDDRVDDDALGAALYTNRDLETIQQAALAPPISKDIANYAGATFYANTRRRHFIDIELKRAGAGSDGIRSDGRLGTFAAGSDTITGVNDVSELRAGMFITDAANGPSVAGTYVPAGTTVLSWTSGPNTIQMSAVALGNSAANTPLDTGDIVTVDTEEYYCWSSTDTDYRLFDVVNNNPYQTVLGLAACINFYGAESTGAFTAQPSAGQDVTSATPHNTGFLRIEERTLTGQFSVTCTDEGDTWAPRLYNSDANQSQNDAFPARLYVSKFEQPEAVPYANFQDVGSTNKAILRIIPTRDSLFVFKEDGVFRVSGFRGFETISVTVIDASLRLLHPEAAALVGDWIYCWTNRGFVRVSDQGTQEISNTPLRRTLNEIQSLVSFNPDAKGVFVAGHENDGQVFFGVPASAVADTCEKLYVFHASTLAWTTHDLAAVNMAHNPVDDCMHVALDGSYAVRKQRRTFGGTTNHADLSYSVTVSGVVGSTVTIAGGSGWTPAVGDLVILAGGARGVVTSIASATVFDVDAANFAPAAGTSYVAFTSTVEFVAQTEGQPGARKVWHQVAWDFDSLAGVRDVELSFTSDISSTPREVDIALTRTESAWPDQLESGIGRAHGTGVMLFPKLTVRQAGAAWVLLGCEVESILTSPHLDRRA
jgi:hypothetical protein